MCQILIGSNKGVFCSQGGGGVIFEDVNIGIID